MPDMTGLDPVRNKLVCPVCGKPNALIVSACSACGFPLSPWDVELQPANVFLNIINGDNSVDDSNLSF
jgi:predicted amidophosphoribosyltransferase